MIFDIVIKYILFEICNFECVNETWSEFFKFDINFTYVKTISKAIKENIIPNITNENIHPSVLSLLTWILKQIVDFE